MQENVTHQEVFAQARHTFERMEEWLRSEGASTQAHAELEEQIKVNGHELLREMLLGRLHVRAIQEERLPGIEGRDGAMRRHIGESSRCMMTIFGKVDVPRVSYSGRKLSDLHPADAALNLPGEKASHGVRKIATEEAGKASFDEAVKAISTHTGARVAKRQVENLVNRAAQDFDSFYESGTVTPSFTSNQDLLVLTCDGKGIVMLHRDLRAATRKAADADAHKLDRRLSPGEKKNRKRMATVAAVYIVAPYMRSPDDVLADLRPVRSLANPRPKAHDKRVWASVVKSPDAVTIDMFDEAERQDPPRHRKWVALVDGDPRQIQRIEEEAARRGVELMIVLDLIHVLEYLWKAAWCFFYTGDPDAQN